MAFYEVSMARQFLSTRGRPNARALSTRGRPNPCELSVALLGLALLAGPVACGSGSDEGADDDATEQSDSASRSDPPPRDERPAATDPQPNEEAADDAEAAAMPANPIEPEAEPEEAPVAPGASAGDSSSVPAAPAAAFASCTRSEGSYGTNCDYVYVTMAQASPERCVQLTIDNCGDSYSRQGLAVDAPLSWKLSSASIGAAADDCELGVYNPESTVVLGASGSIEWPAVASTALPTGIVLDVTLQPSSTADDTSSIDVVTTEPLTPARCAD